MSFGALVQSIMWKNVATLGLSGFTRLELSLNLSQSVVELWITAQSVVFGNGSGLASQILPNFDLSE